MGPAKGPLVPFPGPQPLPASAINSGDYLAILRYSASDRYALRSRKEIRRVFQEDSD